MSTVSTSDVFYDSADFEIMRNPYPTFKRMHDEAPLYYNEERDFYTVTRFDDVASVLSNNKTFINKYGGTIDLIKSGIEIPPGTVLFEDEPFHGIHRSLFSPRVLHTEECCRPRRPDPSVLHRGPRRAAARGLRLRQGHRRDRPDAGDRNAPRPHVHAAGRATARRWTTMPRAKQVYPGRLFDTSLLIDYVTWRRDNPSNDVVTKLLTTEYEDTHGEMRTMTLDELLMFVNVLAAAGNETTGRLITYCGQLLAEHPDQRRMVVENLNLVGGAVEEALRYEPPAIEAARYVTEDFEIHGGVVPAGSTIAAVLAAANRDERHYDEPDVFDITAQRGRTCRSASAPTTASVQTSSGSNRAS